jgi:hypothetical protein
LIADYENIKVSDAYDLNVIHYFNTLAYIKDKNKMEVSAMKKQQLKSRR